MAITIHHLEGPLAGQEQHFDDSVAVITFGRSPDCDVVYPLECIDVGRKHFALRHVLGGDYRVELFGHRYVAIDGVPAQDGMLVRSGSVIRLGRPDGPSFRVELRSESVERERWMANIAVEAEDDADDLLESTPAEQEWASAVDLLVRRKSQPPAVTAGIPADVLATRGRHQSSQPSSRPKGVGSGGPPPEDAYPEDSYRLPRAEVRYESMPEAYMPAERLRMRRSSGLFWWVALALGAGLIGYWLFGRGIALGAALGKILPAAVPPPPAPKATKVDLVDVSVFGRRQSRPEAKA